MSSYKLEDKVSKRITIVAYVDRKTYKEIPQLTGKIPILLVNIRDQNHNLLSEHQWLLVDNETDITEIGNKVILSVEVSIYKKYRTEDKDKNDIIEDVGFRNPKRIRIFTRWEHYFPILTLEKINYLYNKFEIRSKARLNLIASMMMEEIISSREEFKQKKQEFSHKIEEEKSKIKIVKKDLKKIDDKMIEEIDKKIKIVKKKKTNVITKSMRKVVPKETKVKDKKKKQTSFDKTILGMLKNKKGKKK